MSDPRTKAGSRRVEWESERDRISLVKVVTRQLGPAVRQRGGRYYWRCPFHDDHDPSFLVHAEKRRWQCYPCGIGGDAVAFVRRLNPGMSFPEAVALLTDGSVPKGKAVENSRTPSSVNSAPRARRKAIARLPGAPREKFSDDERTELSPSGMPEAEALALVETAAARLWTPEGADTLTYLHGRGLTDETIRNARLGVVPPLDLPGHPRGIVVPWFHRDRLALAKLRQPEGMKPKYREVFRDPTRLICYPGPRVIRLGRPLVIVEGELDALFLGQELSDLAAVVTLGSASARPEPGILGRLLAAFPWYVATDNDPAGDKAAADWPPITRRVRPPMLRPHPSDGIAQPSTDWTDLHQHGVNLRRWWIDRLGGNENPLLFTWEELSALRWGPALNDPEPGIVIGHPDPAPGR